MEFLAEILPPESFAKSTAIALYIAASYNQKEVIKLILDTIEKILTEEKRLEALKMLLNLDKSTTKAIPYAEWLVKPNVVYI